MRAAMVWPSYRDLADEITDISAAAGITVRKHSARVRWVTGAVCGQADAGSGGCQGLPVMAARRTSMTLRPCLRAVSV